MDEKTIARFWAKVDKREPDECWPWKAGKNNQGYGRYRVSTSKLVIASRFALSLALGRELVRTEDACHRCDNPSCVNPAHLFLGSRLDNIRDMLNKGRNAQPKGERHNKARLTDASVLEMRRLYAEGVSGPRLAVLFGVAQTTANRVVSRQLWRHI